MVVNEIIGCSVEIKFVRSVVFRFDSAVENSMVEFNFEIVVTFEDGVDDVNGAIDNAFSVSLFPLETVVSSYSSVKTVTLSVVTGIASLIVVFVGIWDTLDDSFSVVNGNFSPNVANIFTVDDAIVDGFVNNGIV